MLPLSEIRRISRTVDESWRSSEADAVADAWGYPAGAARWLRSSATHVFVLPGPEGDKPPAYLRFVPEGSLAGAKLRRSVPLLARWADEGLGSVRPMESAAGLRCETLRTPAGRAVAMVVPAAAGAEVSVDELSTVQAAAWGAALAGLHASGDAHERVPNGQETEPDGLRDRRLARAMREIAEEVASLDSGQHSRGICHGDFELDNIRFGPRGVTFFDADEAHWGWFAGDVALAVRDLTGTTLDSREYPGLLAAFLAGYRSRRPFTAAEEASLPLHSLAASMRLIRQLEGVVDVEDHGQAQWVRELAASLREHQEWHRERLLQHRI